MKLKSAYGIFQNEGIKSLILETGQYILARSTLSHSLKRLFGDELHQKAYMFCRLGYWPNIKNPRTFNEKIMHRKLYTNNSQFSIVEDKWAVREYVAERVNKEILPDVYCVTNEPNRIQFDRLPNEFVLKPTHLSGPLIIIDEYEDFNEQELIEICSDWLEQTHGKINSEYWYDEIPPQILVEERLKGSHNYVPNDYKIYVFNGKAKFISVYQNRFDDDNPTELSYYDQDWNYIDVKKGYKKGTPQKKPEKMDEMLKISEELARAFDFIRVDLYQTCDGNIKFGEMTVAEGSGGNPFVPFDYDLLFGNQWEMS